MADPPAGPAPPAPDPGAATVTPPVVRALGEATIEAAPELADFCVTVGGRAKGHWETLDRVTRLSEECLALISAYGPAIQDIHTSRPWVSPEVNGPRDKVRWYRGVARTRFAVSDFSVLGELMSRLALLPPEALEGPRWRLRPDSPAHHEALEQAVRVAMARAGEYAKAAGGQLSGLLELADSALTTTAGADAPAAATDREASHMPGPAAMDLEPVAQTVRASVAASFTMTHPASLEVRGL
jgi:uncharacterized protein